MSAVLVRSMGPGTALLRSAEAGATGAPTSAWDPHPAASTPLLTGQFARFSEWTEINNSREGRFLERIAPGAFTRTMKQDRPRMRILFQHGADPMIGDKPIAALELLGEDQRGGFFGGYLFPVEYALQLVPALRAGQLGSSFRFAVIREQRDDRPRRSDYNPEGLPERTIREAQVFEMGPVTFPAYSGTTAGVRAGTDAPSSVTRSGATSRPRMTDEEWQRYLRRMESWR
jgi:HK97 family phage prohead protease